METLDQALSRVWEHDWRHRRSGATLRSQAEIAVYSAKRMALGVSGLKPQEYLNVKPSDVSQNHIQLMTSAWYAQGLSPATIQKRLNCLSKLGVNVEGCRVKVPKQLKWHLKESDKPKVLEWLRAKPSVVYKVIADFIEWTTLTGLRIEESLRLTWDDIERNADGLPIAVSVPGLKTATSQATLPLGATAGWVLCRGEYNASKSGRLFNLKYELLAEIWDEARKEFGWDKDPTATLKALRRSAARYLHIDCGMPLHMVQQYLRHESMDTTLEYLRLTGGYGTEEMRRYLR